MKGFTLSLLFIGSAVLHAEPDVQIFFPDQAATVDGLLVHSTQALVVKTIDGLVSTETFNLANVSGLNIPDNASVTGFTARNNGPSFTHSYIFSLSVSAGDYVRGDVIECDFNGCSLFDSFGENATISALDYINRVNDLYVSFDTSFEVDNNWIEPRDVYRSSDFAVVFDGSNNGLNDNNSITAFDTSEFAATFSPMHMFNSVDGLVKASSVYSSNLETNNIVVEELASEVSAVNAYYSIDSGWLEFEEDTINVAENAGFFSFNIARVDGFEGATSAVVIDVEGTAIDGVDYNGLLNQYSWLDGDNQSINVTLSLIDNNIIDGSRTFTLDLRERNNDYSFSLVNPNKNLITVNILDDDAGDLIFADDFE